MPNEFEYHDFLEKPTASEQLATLKKHLTEVHAMRANGETFQGAMGQQQRFEDRQSYLNYLNDHRKRLERTVNHTHFRQVKPRFGTQ